MAMINLLENARSLNDIDALRIYHVHQLSGDRKGLIAIDLGRKLGYRLIVCPLDHNNDRSVLSVWYESIVSVSIEEVSNHYE